MSLAESIAEQLGGKKCGSGWVVPAICHNPGSKKRNLQISDGENGRLSAYCHSGNCDYRTIMRALEARGLKSVDRLTPQNTRSKKAVQRVATLQALLHEMLVLTQFIETRLSDISKQKDKHYLKIHPEYRSMPSDLWEREQKAINRIYQFTGELKNGF